jgi:hypothetical protein
MKPRTVIRDDSTRRDAPGVASGALLGCMAGLEIKLFFIGPAQGRKATRAPRTFERLTRNPAEPGHRVRSP